jgi:hypothetical protein
MKKQVFKHGLFFGLLLAANLFLACSSDEVQSEQQLINIAKSGKIILSVQEFGAEQVITRAAQLPTKPQIVDLEDGMTAEISVEKERETHTPVTRATPTDGHYCLYALNASNQRVGNLLRGTVKTTNTWIYTPTPGFPWGHQEVTTTFTADAGSNLELPSGTYKFVCYNEGVTDDGTHLSITNGTKVPLIGTTTATITDGNYELAIEMKHPTARVLLVLTGMANGGENPAGAVSIKGKLTSTTMVARQFSPDATSSTLIAGSNVLNFDFSNDNMMSTAGMQYLLPGNGADFKLDLTNGTYYRKSIGTLKTTLAALGTFSANDSYRLKIKIRPSFVYLFNNGTTDYLKNKGSRIPIGIVIRKKTATTKGLAVALNLIAGSYAPFSWPLSTYKNKQIFNSLTDAIKDMNGYAYTWDATTSANNELKANSNHYPAFKAAAHYNPGVATSGIGKWFLPSLGQIELMMYTLGFSRNNSRGDTMVPYAFEAFTYAFSQVGSVGPLTTDHFIANLCSSTEGSYAWGYWANSGNGFYQTGNGSVLPFVEF